jgi:peptide/nickel transport system substrate-binding protein
MRRGTGGRLAAILFLLALVAGACGSDNGDSPADAGSSGKSSGDGSTTTAQPKAGGSITHGVYSETAGLDPVVATGGATTGNIEMAAIYDVLLRYNPDTGKYEGQTAQSVEASPDFTTWTLKLKPNIKFSDGTDYDAEAVVYSMKRHTQFASRSAGLLANVKSYEVIDKLTVKFTLNGPWPSFEYVLSTTPGLIPSPAAIKAACGENQETKPRDCSFNLKPVGAGPFVIDSYKPKDSITMRRNADYWGGQVYLDSLKFVNLNGAPPTYEAIKANTLQTGFLREPETIKKAQDEKSMGGVFINKQWLGSVAVLNNGKVNCKGGQPAAVCGGKPDGVMEMNTPTADRRVRQAIAYALDPKVMDQRTYNGAGMPGGEFFHTGSKWESSGPVSEYNPEKAKALVEEVKTARSD